MGLFGGSGRGGAERDAAKALACTHGERALAWAPADDGVLLVATDRALHVGGDRVPWDRVAKAAWDSDDAVLTLVASGGPGEPARTRRIEVQHAIRLLEAVRSMVTSNLVVSERITSPEFGGAWVTARRDPDSDGLRWTVVFDPGLDPRDAGRRAWADEKVAAIRVSTGV